MKIIKKTISLTMSLSTLFLSVFCFVPITNAKTVMYITGNVVRFRSGPGTEYAHTSILYSGDEITLEDTTTTNKSDSCPAGWYQATYNGEKGYVCANYVSKTNPEKDEELSYNLPWTSPKKAILGGAEWISEGYIAQGQNTSYLKKFNVTPDDTTPYDHQYMANVEAPYSEALTSYRSYKENNLLSLPLHFSIPVFLEMPDYTTHPVKCKKTGGLTTIKDEEFEKLLEKEQFPESYRVWLRQIHETYPNWTFKALHTNLDFNISVEREKTVCSINKYSCSACVDDPAIETEKNWFIATKDTIAYYLDPRNFLEPERILMFEHLGYDEIYTEEVVKSVLENTFMSGVDHIDKIAYSTIFMEAGKTYNVNPVYLASLSRQEVGTKQGLVTSGSKFEYKGISYVGFYNFYNIGAKSEEENPAKAGLVYASKGASRNEEGVYVGNFIEKEEDEKVEVPEPSDKEDEKESVTPPVVTPPVVVPPIEETYTSAAKHLSNMQLNRKGAFLTNFTLDTTVKQIKNKTVSEEVTIKNAKGNILGETEKLTTGCKISFKTGESYEVVIYGDLTGDGNINGADLLKMRQYLLGQTTLEGAYLEAAHVYTLSGKVNGADLLKLRQHLLGKNMINQA